MDSFSESTELIKMKEKYNRFLKEGDSLTFGNTRHNLLPDFEDTPVKTRRVMNTSSNKRSFAMAVSFDESDLRKQLAEREADVILLKANITQLEGRLSFMEVVSREARIEYDKEVTRLKAEKDRADCKVVELKSKLHYVMEKEKNSREDIQRLESELQHQKQDMDKKLLAVQKEKLDVADRAQQAKSSWLEAESEMHAQITAQMREISDLHMKLGEAQAQLDLRKGLQVENNQLKRELDMLTAVFQEEQDKNKELEKKFTDYEDNLVITKALKSDLDLVPSMKSELEKLRMDNDQLRYNEQNTLLLEEEVRSLRKQLELATSKHERFIELEVENEELQGRLHRWEAADMSGSRRPQSPSSLARRIQELETNQADLSLKEGELQANFNSIQRKLDDAMAENHRLLAELSKEKNSGAQAHSTIKQLKRKLLLVTGERDSYKSLLDSYESEVTVHFDAEKNKLIQSLEAVIKGYKEQSSELEVEIRTLSEKLSQAQRQCSQLQQQLQTAAGLQGVSRETRVEITQLRERVSELETNLATVQQEKDILEARIDQRQLQGDYDPSKTKIVHMTMNPCAVAYQARAQQLEKLKEENDNLRKRNQILEEHGGQVQDLTLQVQEKLQQPSPSKEVEELKNQLHREEMRNKRLMEVFKKTSQEFREVCYQLTGYRIDIQCSNQYKLISMYAESSRDYFLFQQNSQGEIQMLQTDFSMTVQDAMETYLQKHNSIPLFLSSITMELFSRQTMNLG
ncbi:hypothetical protein BsWGS_20520 [Bradybaena similaris]